MRYIRGNKAAFPFLTVFQKADNGIFISKNKVDLAAGLDIKTLFEKIKAKYSDKPINTEDGLKINFDDGWVHLRSSNTEPIIRIYAESDTTKKADQLAEQIRKDIVDLN